MLKLVNNAPKEYEIRSPPPTRVFEEAVKWFTEVSGVLEKIRTLLNTRKADMRAERIIQAIEAADEKEHTNPSQWFRSLRLFKAATQSRKKQTNVINEVDPKQKEKPEYEGATPELHTEGVRKYYSHAAQPRIFEDSQETPWITPAFCEKRNQAKEKYRGELTAEITIESLEETLKGIAKGKACGPDDIPIELLQYLPQHAKLLLTHLFNRFLESTITPDEWRHCRIYTIHKGGDIAKCSNFRPISLQSVVYKTFSKILTARLADWVESNELLSNSQGGFRKQRGSLEKVALLSLLTQEMRKTGHAHILFADVKKAYDSVPIAKLAAALAHHKIDPRFVQLISNVYQGNTADVITVHGPTKKFDVLRGVKQGDPLSCLLFTLFLEPAIDWIHHSLQQERGAALAFADDIAIICRNQNSLQQATDKLQQYLTANGLEFGVSEDKSKTVYMTSDPATTLTIRQVVTEVRDGGIYLVNREERRTLPKLVGLQSYKYLGIWWNIDGDSDEHLRRTYGKLCNALSNLEHAHFTRQQSLTIINRIIIPAMSYGFEVTKPGFVTLQKWDNRVKMTVNIKCGIYRFSTPYLHYLPKDMMGEGLVSFANMACRANLRASTPERA